MNILFIYYKGVLPNAGGVARITYSLVKLFREKGNNVSLLGVKNMNDSGYDYHQFFFPSSTETNENYLFFDEMCKNERYNIIISQIPLIHTWVYNILEKYKSKYKYKIISCLHNPVLSQVKNLYYRKGYVLRNYKIVLRLLKKGPFLNALIWYYKRKYKDLYVNMLNHSDRVVVLCEGMYNELLEMMGKNKIDKVSIIPNFIDDATTDEALMRSKEKNIIWCGDINFDIKRIDIALSVWARLCKYLPEWKLYILGDGRGLAEAKTLSETLKLDNCFFEGRVDPRPYYEKAAFTLVTSSYESFSLVTLESLSFGVIPVVFNTFPASELLIDDAKNGFLVKPYDIDSCVNLIKDCINHEGQIDLMSRAAHKSATRFSRSLMYNQWKNLF